MTSTDPSDSSAIYPYPTVRRSGLDVLLIGIVTVAASLAGAASGEFPLHPGVFFPGFLVAIAIFLGFKRRLTIGQVSVRQDRAIRFALILEGVLILLAWLLVRDITARQFWVLVLLAVGVHFVPFVLSAGPLIGWLAGLTILNAVLGLLIPVIPFVLFGVVHGLLCIVFGGVMLATSPSGPGSTSVPRASFATSSTPSENRIEG